MPNMDWVSKAWQDADGRWRGEDGQPLEYDQVEQLLRYKDKQAEQARKAAEKPTAPMEKPKP